MLLSRFLLAAPLLAAIAPLTTAGILTVGPAGSGAQFTQIQAAINAAHDDDMILVKPGGYLGIVVAKPLRILGDGTGNVFVDSCLVRDIGAGKEVVLSLFLTTFLLQNCAGTVVLHGMFVFPGDSRTGVRIVNCRRALLLDSRIIAGIFGPNRGGAVSAQDSEVWIANSDVRGTADCCFATRASHGIELANSTLYVWRSRIHGGDANSKQGSGFADGGTGIKAVGSTVNLFGGPTSLVSGGFGFRGFGVSQNSPGGPGLDLALNSRARIQQSIPVDGGLDSERIVRAPAIQVDATSSFTLDPKVFPTLSSSARNTQLGSTFALTLEGNSGGYQVLFLSLRSGPTTIYPRVDGFGLLDRATMVKVASEVLPPSAVHTLDFHVPNNLVLLGSTLFFQAAEKLPHASLLRSTGSTSAVDTFAIGNPVLVTISR